MNSKTATNFLLRVYVISLFFILSNCNLAPNGHGSLQGYCYSTTKEKLESAVMATIKNNRNIYRDTSKHFIEIINEDSSGKKTMGDDNYYNDGKNYVTIKITSEKEENEYIFRYYGDEKYWETSPNSQLFICYADGGSEGNGKLSSERKEHLTRYFETEFISKLDKELNLVHTNGQ